METLCLIKKTREYLDYIEIHIRNVIRAWVELQDKCKDMRFIHDDYVFHSIDSEVTLHDKSKLSEAEFVQYRKAFYPLADEPKYDMTSAWEHHKKNNLHHWESWTKNISLWGNNPYKWEIHCVHMVIDWMAMGYKFGDTAQEFYEKNKGKIILPSYAVDFIYQIFKRLK